MKLAGLRTDVPDDKFIEFAESLAREGGVGITEALKAKSRVLIEFLLMLDKPTSRKDLCERLGTVKFIPPHIVTKDLLSICRQCADCTSLICFSGSISASFDRLCWTSIPLLPEWIDRKSEGWRQLSQHLGVYSQPPIANVVTHCQNVCDTQKKVLSGQAHDILHMESLKCILENVYSYLFQHKDSYPEMKVRLEYTPIVLIPESWNLLPVSKIVIDLHEEDAVEPYLYKAPSYFGKYHELFVYLGDEKKVTCNHYFMILKSIYQQQTEPNDKLLPNEVIIVRTAIDNLVKLLTRTNKNMDLKVETLYLPNRDWKLKDAKSLIVSDQMSYEERLVECNLDFFVGFLKLKIDAFEPRPFVKALPEWCRPKLLSEIAEVKVDTSEMTILESIHAENIEQFLHSTEFLDGILRLAKHMKSKMTKPFTREEEEKISTHLQNLQIRKVNGLYTYIILNGQKINSSRETEECSTQQEIVESTVHYTLYFQSENEIDTEQTFDIVQSEIVSMVRVTIVHSYDIINVLYDMLKCYKGHRSINQILDRHHIDPYDRPQGLLDTVFPSPGTYVPKEFHPFLEQGFSEFQKYEYNSLAYELEDDIGVSDSAEPVYIYVHIKHPVQSEQPGAFGIKQQYVIDIGHHAREHITVYGYTLFKFERKRDTTVQDVLPADSVPIGSLPFDDVCHQIKDILQEAWSLPEKEFQRILKRLMLKWHPDKNFGREDYSTRVFVYIKDVVSRLESGQSLDDINFSTSNSETRDVFTGTVYEDLGRRVNHRNEQYRQQHSDQQHNFYQAHTRRHRAYRGSEPTLPAPDQPSARRWILQAKRDFISAKVFHPLAENVPAFNWICYHSHQATEKALKAAIYAVDANKVDQKSHQLTSIASKGGLSQDLVNLASDLQLCLGEHTRMRYPDPIARTQIPSELYTDEQARSALEIAEKIVKLVEENYFS